MKTLGIDLSSQPKDTAACVIDWDSGAAKIVSLKVGLTDDDIVRLAPQCDKVGIDAPFGWPLPFVDFLNRGNLGGLEWTADCRDTLCLRLTDHRVHRIAKIQPLKVTADKIAVTAMRCSGLLDRLGVLDRSGEGKVVEVYPAAALRVWGFPHQSYKAKNKNDLAAQAKLFEMFTKICSDCEWFSDLQVSAHLCSHNDDAFDALIASLVTRAAAIGMTVRPAPEEAERARREGWIALPSAESLGRLVSA